VGGIGMDKKFVDVTDRVTQAPDLDGSLKAFDYMMRGNRGSVIEEGEHYGQGAIKAAKASKKRNRDATKTDRRYRNHHNKR